MNLDGYSYAVRGWQIPGWSGQKPCMKLEFPGEVLLMVLALCAGTRHRDTSRQLVFGQRRPDRYVRIRRG